MEYCPFCGAKTIPEALFCQNCGKKLRDNLSGSFKEQLKIYSISFFIPPLGFFRGYRYLKQKDPKMKAIGITAIALTVISLLLVLWITNGLMNEINREMESFKSLGF